MAEPSKRALKMARDLLFPGSVPDGDADTRRHIETVAEALDAEREEGRREPRPITRKERVPFVVAQEDSSARPITETGPSEIIRSDADEALMLNTALKCYGTETLGLRVSTDHYRYLVEQIISLRQYAKRPRPITDAVVEAAARAAYAKDWEAPTVNLRDGHFDSEKEWVKTDWRNLARAALEAAERAR